MIRIAITPGEPAGIGPDLCIGAAQKEWPVELVVVADGKMLRRRAGLLGLPLRLHEFDPDRPRPHQPGQISVLSRPLGQRDQPGRLDPANAPYVLDTLRVATALCMDGQAQALVTGPVQKSVINDAGISFSGHTELLADLTATPQVVMMLATDELRVALATTHLPLADVASHITRDSLRGVIRILHRDLVAKFGIPKPRILVCGLNPHAGEGGHLGQEEILTIGPVLEELRLDGMNLLGPLPADTLFIPKYLDNADAVLAMYHDQGLPVLKHAGFGKAINITLGLPIIRTSVDHGTALDLAGSGAANPGSMLSALQTAIRMARRQRP